MWTQTQWPLTTQINYILIYKSDYSEQGIANDNANGLMLMVASPALSGLPDGRACGGVAVTEIVCRILPLTVFLPAI